ncbi:MAG: hypothetical protein ACE5LB_15165 [Acidiferrobacterales bacterium]
MIVGLKIGLVFVLVAFLPLSALTYYKFRLEQRKLEVKRILDKLQIRSDYREIHTHEIGARHFVLAVGFACAVSLAGLTTLFLANELKLTEIASLPLQGAYVSADVKNNETPQALLEYQHGALLVYGMAFLGAYLWGLHNIFRRYSMNDLIPGAYYALGMRMIFASVIALLMYHVADALINGMSSHTPKEDLSQVGASILPAVAFFIGMFPQRGVRWLTNRLNFPGAEEHPSVRPLPLEMIEGMTAYDTYRLEELGIDTCYDLASADYIPLLLRTPYGARELIDWILQAKLCVRFGQEVKVLRERGYRTIIDLLQMPEQTLEQLARDTPLTVFNLQRAAKATEFDHNIERLQAAGQLLGEYWEGESNRSAERARHEEPSRRVNE